VPCPVQPLFGVREDVENADRNHSIFQEPFKRSKTGGVWAAPETLQDRLSFFDAQIFVLWKCLICFARRFFQLALQGGDKGLRLSGHAGALPIRCQVPKALLFAHELLSEIAVAVAAGDAKVAGLQFAHHLRDRAQLEPAPRDMRWFSLGRARHHKGPPRLSHEREIERRSGFLAGSLLPNRESVLTAFPVCNQICNSVRHAFVGRC